MKQNVKKRQNWKERNVFFALQKHKMTSPEIQFIKLTNLRSQ